MPRRRAAENDRPWPTVSWDEPQGVVAGLHLMFVEKHVVIERDPRRRVGAGMPDAIPGNELSEERAAPRHRPAVGYGHGRERDLLRDAASLTRRISLPGGACRQRESGGVDDDR